MLKLALTKLGLKRLEPYDGKLSRTVLRGWRRWQHLLYYPTLKRLLIYLLLLIALNAVGYFIARSEAVNEIANQNYTLRVFVSSSMPLSLLKSYAIEAKNYNATLVFKGLPNGSFKELSKLVLSMQEGQIGDEEDMSAIQIDDEAFERFKITLVPSIVLSSEPQCEAPDTCKTVYDKVDGNLKIQDALERFAANGDLKAIANRIIKEAAKENIK